MYQFIQIATFILLVGMSSASMAVGPSPVHPDHPDQCWSVSQKKAYADGALWQEPNCVKATCTAYNGKMYLQYTSCPKVGVPPGCTTKRDLTLPYPRCCPLPHCTEKPSEKDLLGPEYEEFTNWLGEYYYDDQPTRVQ